MGEPPKPDRGATDDVLSALGQNLRKVDASELRGQVRVLKRSELRKMVEELLERYGSSSKQQLMDRREQMLKLIEEGLARQDELKRLIEGGREGIGKLTAHNQQVAMQVDAVRSEEQARLDPLQPVVSSLEQALSVARAAIGGTQGQIAEIEAKMEALRRQIAALHDELERDPLRRRLRDLEAQAHALAERVHELLAALDFFALEDLFDASGFQGAYAQAGKLMEPVAAKLEGDEDRMARAKKLRDEMVALNDSVEAETGKLDRLIEKMNNGDAGVKVVMDIIEKTRRLGAQRDRMRILADSLVVLAG